MAFRRSLEKFIITHLRKNVAASSICESPWQMKFENYNSFFHPNLCHVCKTMMRNRVECPWCRMISYCSVAHMKLHQPEHVEICGAIVKLNLSRDVRDFRGETLMECIKFKKDNINDIIPLLNYRDLEPYEKQMFLFPKSCYICYTQKNLSSPCQRCSSINICEKHDFIYHECKLLKQSCELDLVKIWSGENREERIFEKCVKYNIIDCPDTKTFIRENIEDRLAPQYSCDAILRLSDDLSAPLSLIYAMNSAGIYTIRPSKKSYVIHILIETPMDKRSVYAWELLLHQFCTIPSLSIEMIGKELPVEAYTLELCRNCTSDKRKIRYRSHNMTYCNYANARKLYKLPNVIVVFNVELTCDNDIIALQYHCCPLLMLAQTKDRIENNVKEIYEILSNMKFSPKFPNPDVYKMNKFMSVRPYRDVTGGVMFPSKYLIYYKNLEGIKDKCNSFHA
ncbi:uncharacterized protein LOC116846863 isoform X2 [Odontomachus brunneus]|uniref:uncharacterized protein LOC116846863 isoform X2 n=1 Tax=Odontomachus brunneus TaxID=486640 RepID=UPI0013F221E5|nr:uncharacterized protein LOC116846863 isoform X2 [Odontomachus brunneus]